MLAAHRHKQPLLLTDPTAMIRALIPCFFALILCTLVHSSAHAPRHLSRRFRLDMPPPRPIAQVDAKGFEELCGEHSDPKHPCFVHWRGSLDHVDIEPFHEPVHVIDEIITKDETRTEFTIRNAKDSFMITYRNGGGVRFIYSDFDKDGCYNVTLIRGGAENWRIWFADDTGNDRDLDTLNEDFTSKKICDKWGHIHIHDDAHWYNQKR